MNSEVMEMKRFWKQTGLAFLGHRFEDDIKNPILVMCMKNGVQAKRRKNMAPTQATFNLL